VQAPAIFTAPTLADLASVAPQLLAAAGPHNIWALEGDMAAGKTTLVKALCQALGADPGEVSSPTYGLVHEYRTASGQPLYHFDFYRIQSLDEARDLGLDEYFASGAYCFLEWPQRIGPLLPRPHIQLQITLAEEPTALLALARHFRMQLLA
jgi:tRNA threonylcarbamoyladenosine biosynthesis protein TsaE